MLCMFSDTLQKEVFPLAKVPPFGSGTSDITFQMCLTCVVLSCVVLWRDVSVEPRHVPDVPLKKIKLNKIKCLEPEDKQWIHLFKAFHASPYLHFPAAANGGRPCLCRTDLK